jgi:hypothetical protein
MDKPGSTLSIESNDHDQTIYLVKDKYKSSSVWHQTDAERSGLEAVTMGMLEDTSERWSEDVSAEVAHELRRRCDLQVHVQFYLEEFVERYEGRYHDMQLPLIRLA